jgi:cytochrome c-type biogenesis protein CcmH/NrfG
MSAISFIDRSSRREEAHERVTSRAHALGGGRRLVACALLLCTAACTTLGPGWTGSGTGSASGGAQSGSSQQGGSSAATQELLAESRAARASGYLTGAAVSVERALRIDPNDPELWLELGQIQLASGDNAQAASLARKALTLAGDDRDLTARAERLLRASGAR